MERKLAHIEKIETLSPILGADKIEVAQVLGWQCVVKKGEFKVGDKVIYVEVDSVMPQTPEYEFLRDKKFRVRTIKLKGEISQGLVIPLPNSLKDKKIGEDVTEFLGITKYLSPSEKEELDQQEINIKKNKFIKFMMKYSWFRKLILSKKSKDGWPYWVSKTDEERVQNLNYQNILERYGDKEVYVTEKIDYQSATFTCNKVRRFKGLLSKLPIYKFQFIVCSRNKVTNNKNDLYWKVAEKYNIEQILKENPTLTIQGEQGSTKVQGNKYCIKEPTMWIFNIIDYVNNYHFNYDEMKEFCLKYDLNLVPLVIWESHKTTIPLWKVGSSVEELVNFSKGKSIINPKIEREGIVIRCIEDGKKVLSFKVINPEFLLKYE